ncbi:MAG TPA: hypothetical protein VJ648_03000 [Vicinamibacteria bacterium]|nr:hypothetical protein [Vicinamibacteria bacterium]
MTYIWTWEGRAAPGLMVAALCAPVIGAAEDSLTLADLSRGDQVWLRLTTGGKSVLGILDAAKPDEIVVRPRDPKQPPLRLSPQQMAKLETVRGRRSRWRQGAVIGFVPGALFMFAFVSSLDECYRDCGFDAEAVGYGLVGGAITGTLGALIGPQSRPIAGCRWRCGDPSWP